MLLHFLHGMLKYFHTLRSFILWILYLVRFPRALWLCKASQLLFTESGSTEDLLTGTASLAQCRQLTFGLTSSNLLFLFVNDWRFCRGFVWQQKSR